MSYDSRPDTYAHIASVRSKLNRVIMDLMLRGEVHDQSKLEAPEKEGFDEWTPKLADMTYGSDEYRAALASLKPFLDHHYANNRHHPEYHPNGIRDMTLVDLIEMLCDWLAATERHNDGDIRRSIRINAERFGYSDELATILNNTIDAYFANPTTTGGVTNP